MDNYTAFKKELVHIIDLQKDIAMPDEEKVKDIIKIMEKKKILPNLAAVEKVIISPDYSEGIRKQARELKTVTDDFYSIIIAGYKTCIDNKKNLVVCLPADIDSNNGKENFNNMDTKKTQLKSMIEESKKSAAATSTIATAAPAAVSESPPPVDTPPVDTPPVDTPPAAAVLDSDQVQQQQQEHQQQLQPQQQQLLLQQQEQQLKTITDVMGVEGQLPQKKKDDDIVEEALADIEEAVRKKAERKSSKMEEGEPNNTPPAAAAPTAAVADPPPPPPPDIQPQAMVDDSAQYDTCAGIENLCFLSNTISRLKFDCVSSLQIMSALNLANLNLNDMSYLDYRTAIDSVPN